MAPPKFKKLADAIGYCDQHGVGIECVQAVDGGKGGFTVVVTQKAKKTEKKKKAKAVAKKKAAAPALRKALAKFAAAVERSHFFYTTHPYSDSDAKPALPTVAANRKRISEAWDAAEKLGGTLDEREAGIRAGKDKAHKKAAAARKKKLKAALASYRKKFEKFTFSQHTENNQEDVPYWRSVLAARAKLYATGATTEQLDAAERTAGSAGLKRAAKTWPKERQAKAKRVKAALARGY